MPEQVSVKPGAYIMVPEHIWTVHFINPFHQALSSCWSCRFLCGPHREGSYFFSEMLVPWLSLNVNNNSDELWWKAFVYITSYPFWCLNLLASYLIYSTDDRKWTFVTERVTDSTFQITEVLTHEYLTTICVPTVYKMGEPWRLKTS
jgi:hypothetical protein